MSYKANTRQELLSMELIKEITEEKCKSLNIEEIEASHVVAGIAYGGKSDINIHEVSFYNCQAQVLSQIQVQNPGPKSKSKIKTCR